MNIKAKSHLKHINIKIYSKKIKIAHSRNTSKYLQERFNGVFCTGWVLKRHISGVPTGTAHNWLLWFKSPSPTIELKNIYIETLLTKFHVNWIKYINNVTTIKQFHLKQIYVYL